MLSLELRVGLVLWQQAKMKIIVTSFLSGITISVILGLLTMNPLALIMTFVIYIIPFLVGTICFHYLDKRLVIYPHPTKKRLVMRISLGYAIAILILLSFNLLDGIYNGFELKRLYQESQGYLVQAALAGFIIPMMYTLVEFIERRVMRQE